MITIPMGEPWDDKGVWKRGLRDGILTATMSCPGCGKGASLTDHEIKPDGTVHPSVVCPHDGCEFHEHLRLEGWINESKKVPDKSAGSDDFDPDNWPPKEK